MALVRLPSHVRRPPASVEQTNSLKRLLRQAKLHTVCEEARCPNIAECFSRKTATFMILGDVCTRGCRFCSVTTGSPTLSPTTFSDEGKRVAEAAAELGLRHVVVTSVARDDLPDGGASGFVATISALRNRMPQATVEVLIPDFRGDEFALRAVLDAKPDVLNHNLETVPRLYRRVRPGSSYQRSLTLLKNAKDYAPEIQTKTGIMLGLGETAEELDTLMQDCHAHRVDCFTAGQYMQPTRDHLPVERYLDESEFGAIENRARAVGIPIVFIGPLVRSSYHAGELVQ